MATADVHDLRIAIVGAGMGGLATALTLARRGFNHIEVYETASNLGFVGAGIQLAPNMARILDRLGVWEDIEREAVDLITTSVRQGASDDELVRIDLTSIRELYGYPHMVGHRSSLAGALYNGCKREKAIAFKFSTTVGEVKSFGPRPSFVARPRTAEPYIVECDILLASDGVKSATREQLLRAKNIEARIVDTGQAAYRIMLTRDQLRHDPELLDMIDANAATRWIGERRHIVAYPVSNKQMYNVSTVQPDVNFADAPSATYTTKGSKLQMLKVFDDFCPKLRRMLDLVPYDDVCEWKLRVHDRLPSWTEAQTALVGDACHPTLPHMAQGAAQAIEDGAVLGVVLDRLPDTSPEAIRRALCVYQEVRMDRAYALVDLAAASGRAMHLGEGAAKEERDRAFAAFMENGKGPMPDRWADADTQKFVYGTDIVRVAEEKFDEIYART